MLTFASGTCTLREAQIISAVLARVSIPVLHSAAAIKTLCDIAAEQASQQSESVSATNFMLKVLLEKKYALRKFKHSRLSRFRTLWESDTSRQHGNAWTPSSSTSSATPRPPAPEMRLPGHCLSSSTNACLCLRNDIAMIVSGLSLVCRRC